MTDLKQLAEDTASLTDKERVALIVALVTRVKELEAILLNVRDYLDKNGQRGGWLWDQIDKVLPTPPPDSEKR